MKVLLEILNSNMPYIYYVTEDFYQEVGKENPMLFLWLADRETNTICISGEIAYKKYLEKCLISSYKNNIFVEIPDILYIVNDKNTSIKIYNILNSNSSNSLKLIIDALRQQPFKLTL